MIKIGTIHGAPLYLCSATIHPRPGGHAAIADAIKRAPSDAAVVVTADELAALQAERAEAEVRHARDVARAAAKFRPEPAPLEPSPLQLEDDSDLIDEDPPADEDSDVFVLPPLPEHSLEYAGPLGEPLDGAPEA